MAFSGICEMDGYLKQYLNGLVDTGIEGRSTLYLFKYVLYFLAKS